MHNDDGYDKFVSCFQLMNYLVIILNDYNIWFDAPTNYTRNIPRKLQWSTNKLFEFTPKKKKLFGNKEKKCWYQFYTF